ncbi:MAG: beta-propeller domain-containing protein, partial [Candidatus Bathyarchaeia archaeon]
SDKGTSTEYSKTNIQVEGVDEADLVKTDGEFIYLASNDKVLIIKAYPPDVAEVVAQVQFNGTVMSIFVNGDRLVVFVAPTQYYYIVKRSNDVSLAPVYEGPKTSINVYNITDRAKPSLARNVTLDGSYSNSRMIGDYVYVLISSPIYFGEDKEVYLPSISDNGQIQKIEAASIYYSNVTDYYYGLTIVIALNVKNDLEPITAENFLIGYAGCIYVSLSNIYLAIPKWEVNGTQQTEIHRIRIDKNKIAYEKYGQVPGYVLNQFSMDEYNGYFRIATTTYNNVVFLEGNEKTVEPTMTNNVYVLNSDLAVVGKREDLAPNEKIYAARFMGERCYLVTFFQVDPLFVISLKDPTNPTVLGKLKIPGYSDYLHPYDENHLIGIGKNATVPKEGTSWGLYQSVKISLFDVSDVEHPIELKSYLIGDRGTDSPVLHDHKAFLFDRERSLLAIPVLVADIDEAKYPDSVPPEAYGEFVFQGLYVFNITANDLTFRGRITHLENMTDPKIGSYFIFDSAYMVQRALYIKNALYTISAIMIKRNDLTTLEEINKIELP